MSIQDSDTGAHTKENVKLRHTSNNVNSTEDRHKNGFNKGILINGYSKRKELESSKEDSEEDIPWIDWSQYDTSGGSTEQCSLVTAFFTQLGFCVLMFLGYINQLLFTPKVATEKNREGYATLYNPFEVFFSRYVYRRVRHCFNRPVTSTPEAELTLKERITDDYNWTFRFTGRELRCINLGSYNYLGFASGEGECATAVEHAIRKYGVSLCSPRAELGTCELHAELEATTARFLGTEDAVVFGMGFGTNVLSLPALLGPGCLVLSDEKNHASLILGLRIAGVTVRVFPHNDVRALERLARRARQENCWKKIVVVCEGVYSMEGSMVPLAAMVAVKKRYGLYLYLDEAHSIGAMGATGRGVSEQLGVHPGDVDVLMGTFTKSFGAAGGYIAGSARLVRWVRARGHAHLYAHSMAPAVAQQVLSSMRAIGWGGGVERVRRLRDNTHYFRARLASMGAIVYGHPDSPVVPMLVYSFSKMATTVEHLTARGVAAVGVGFPATPLNECRIRFCLSAAHTREHLERSLEAIAEVVRELGLDYSRRPLGPAPCYAQ